jgi:predicted ester cyclase
VHHSYPGLPPGPDGYKEVVREFRQAFTEFSLVVEDLVVEGDKAVTRWSIRGVHGGGPLLGVAPTGKEVRIDGIVIARIEDGKVAEEWEQFDALGLMEQLGVAPGAPGADAEQA